MTTPVYTMEDVGLSYRAHKRRVPVLSGFGLEVLSGERVVLRGASGSGKTTILNLMAGFLTPTQGRVRFHDRDLAQLSGSELAALRNSRLGMVHQFFNLIPSFSSLANTAAPLIIAGCSRRTARERAMHMLERVGVAGRAEHYPGELSGGEQQRVAIARALVCRPAVILADEPTGNLDASTGAAILRLLDDVAGDQTTMVLATHDDNVMSFGSRLVELGAATCRRSSP